MEKHKAIPQGYMTVGEVAKKMGVTVRTLQYYDKECRRTQALHGQGFSYTSSDYVLKIIRIFIR